MEWVYMILIGLAAGFLGGQIMKGRGFGLVGNLIVGLVGAVLGGAVASLLGLGATNILGQLLIATGGAVLLLALVGVLKKA